MSFIDKKYEINGRHGDTYSLTAKELYERVLEDSKSDYNWIAYATELVRICNEPYFPEMYAIGIKTLILNCFANLELQKEYFSNKKATDKKAVYFCYHSLPNTDNTAKKVKEKYLTAVITSITYYTESEVRFPTHFGETYRKKVEEWKKAKFDEYVSTEIDFDQLKENLYSDFDQMVQTAEQEGAFEKDDKKYLEQLNKSLNSIRFKLD